MSFSPVHSTQYYIGPPGWITKRELLWPRPPQIVQHCSSCKYSWLVEILQQAFCPICDSHNTYYEAKPAKPKSTEQ